MLPLSRVLMFAVVLALAAPVVAQPKLDVPPKVLVLGTGGTIAGEQRQPGTLGRYDIKKSVNEIVAAVPEIQKYANVETEQFSNISSPNIAPEHWLGLASRINKVLRDRSDLAGIVVTHGTDRLEETAFFLYLAVRSDKPVVVVGAQRPPTGIGPDGPLNLLSAVRVAASPEAVGKGTLVVMDERIMSARDVTKIYGRSGGFDAIEMGMLGIVTNESVEFFYAPTRRHNVTADFDVSGLTSLPHVSISHSFAGSPGLADPEAKGIVVAVTSLAPGERKYYAELRRKGTLVATTFASGANIRAPPQEKDVPPLIVVKHLNPLKARILMMLALTRTKDPVEVQRFFDQY